MNNIELYRSSTCIFVGSLEDCEKAKKILDDYHYYDCSCENKISIRKPITQGTEQQYITNVLDPNINFKYGY